MNRYLLQAAFALILFCGTSCATTPPEVPPTPVLQTTPGPTIPPRIETVPAPTATEIPLISTPSVSSTVLTPEVISSPTFTTGWTTYTDAGCNVQFQYPDTWFADPTRTPDEIDSGSVRTVYIIVSEPTPLAGGGGPHSGLKIQLFCDPMPANAEPRTIVNDLIAAEQNGGMDPIVTPVTPPTTEVSVNGYQAFTTVFEGAGLPTRVFYILPPDAQRNRIARLSFSPDGLMPEIVETILNLWQFLE